MSLFFNLQRARRRSRVYNERSSDTSSIIAELPLPARGITLPPSHWNLAFYDDQLEARFRQWYNDTFRASSAQNRVQILMWALLGLFATAFFSVLLLFVHKHEEGVDEVPHIVIFVLMVAFNLYCLSAHFQRAQSTLWSTLTSALLAIIIASAGTMVVQDIEAVLLSFREGSSQESNVAESELCGRSILDNVQFSIIAVSGFGVQVTVIRTLESEYMMLRLVINIVVSAILTGFIWAEAQDVSKTLPGLLVVFTSNMAFLLCMYIFKRESEKQKRKEFLAIVSNPSLCDERSRAAGVPSEKMAADTSGSHCGEANKKPFSAVLCEATAKALRKTRDDRLAMLTCRNKDVLLLGSIGQGNFGQVYRARFRGAIVAVKTYEFSHVEGDEMKTFWHEVTISRRLSHPNILSFYGASVSAPEKKAYCILELCERGTFDDVLANPELSWLNARRKIMLGLCRAMCYLHAFLADVVIHHDLKPANVLVTTGFDAKVSDFGVSLVAERDPQSLGAVLVHEQHPSESDEQEEEEQQQASEGQGAQKPRPSKPLRGSPVYLAPEAHRCEAISEKIDVYAFGLVLCEALIGDGLYVIKAYSSKGKSMKESLEHGFRPGIPESIRAAMPELVALVQDCWAEEASARPCFQEINQRLESIVEEENLNLSSAASLSSRSSSTSCRLGAPEAGHDGVAPSQAAEASLRSELEGDRDATEKLRMEISARARDAPQPGSGSRSGVCKELEITTKGLSEEALIADREAKPLAEATGTSEGPRAAAGPVGLLQRMETQRFPMSAQRSPTGRSYSTFAQSITLGNGQDTTVFRELCAELQEELRQQSELYESKLAEQKARYEEQLASLTDALF